MDITVEKLAEFVKLNDSGSFKSKMGQLSKEMYAKLPLLLEKIEIKNAIQWCRDIGIYLIHEIFKEGIEQKSLNFLSNDRMYYKEHHLLNKKNKSWLHIAVIHNQPVEILRFLVNEFGVETDLKDIYGYSALHFSCQKKTMTEDEFNILIKNSHKLLILKSSDDITPLELACGDPEKLKIIKKVEKIQLRTLLIEIDNISKGLPESSEPYLRPANWTHIDIWINLLHKNCKYTLITNMKNDNKFKDIYYLKSKDFYDIILKCNENGRGLLTFIKNNEAFNGDPELICERLFTELTGCQIEKASEQGERVYYKSVLFLALITGRLEIVPTLLMYCQFNIILYGLLSCLLCQKFALIKDFPDEITNEILKVKGICERYSVEVLNRTVVRDLTEGKKTISGFLNRGDKLTNLRILDIAHLGKSSKFLSLPSCQEALTKLWYEKTRDCPAAKFYVHSIFHCIFLIFFSYILINNLFADISTIEICCYIYGVGYFVEKLHQMYINSRNGFIGSYLKEPTNVLDVIGTVLILLGGILRLAYPIPSFSEMGEEGLLTETKDKNLFCMRCVLCASLITYFSRTIYYGFIFEQLGPKLKMIAKMIVRDLMPLIFIFLVFIVAFGIIFQSLLFPNSFYTLKLNNEFERKPIEFIISDVFRRATFTIFDAHYCLEEMEDVDGLYYVNEQGKKAVYVLLIIYVVVVNVMLMNLLIAIFSNTVTVINERSHESWKAGRYKKIKDYLIRSSLPPPLNIAEILVSKCYWIFIKLRIFILKRVFDRTDVQEPDDNYDKYIVQFMSFKILQAFGIKDNRYKLVRTNEDKEQERKVELKIMKKDLETMISSLENIKCSLKNRGITI